MNASTTTPAVEAPITTFTNLAARKKMEQLISKHHQNDFTYVNH